VIIDEYYQVDSEIYSRERYDKPLKALGSNILYFSKRQR
jgi:hypothetical protein